MAKLSGIKKPLRGRVFSTRANFSARARDRRGRIDIDLEGRDRELWEEFRMAMGWNHQQLARHLLHSMVSGLPKAIIMEVDGRARIAMNNIIDAQRLNGDPKNAAARSALHDEAVLEIQRIQWAVRLKPAPVIEGLRKDQSAA